MRRKEKREGRKGEYCMSRNVPPPHKLCRSPPASSIQIHFFKKKLTYLPKYSFLFNNESFVFTNVYCECILNFFYSCFYCFFGMTDAGKFYLSKNTTVRYYQNKLTFFSYLITTSRRQPKNEVLTVFAFNSSTKSLKEKQCFFSGR